MLYFLAGQQIVAALTSLHELRALAHHYLLDGMFIGASRGAEMRNSMAVAAVGYVLTLFSVPWLGNHGLWLALAVFLILRGLTLGWRWHLHRVHGSWFAAPE